MKDIAHQDRGNVVENQVDHTTTDQDRQGHHIPGMKEESETTATIIDNHNQNHPGHTDTVNMQQVTGTDQDPMTINAIAVK